MLKKSYKWLAVVLALSVLFSCLPMSVFALELSNDDSDVIIEDESQREESVKHFLMPDGSYKAVVYTQPVHRMDANGVWQDIDNRMDESTVKNKQAYVTSDGRTVFSKKISSKDATVFELTENGYSIKVSFANDGIKNTTAKLSNHAEKYKPTGADDIETQYKKLNMIDNNTTIAYRNLLKGMTLEYVLSGNDVKENIVIKRKADDYTYAFIYELENLFAELNEDGSIALFDENSGDFVCEIPAPYMYDDDGAVSYDVSYALEDLGDGAYKLTVSADEEWINSSERAFPVVIDPTMTFDIDYKDTYINSSSPNTNYGGEDELWVNPSKITFLQFSDIPRLGDYVTVISAKIRLRYYYPVKTGSLTVGAYQVTENWNEHSLTWNTANAKTNMGISTTCQGTAVLTVSESITEETPGLASIYITSLMESWIAGATNYGLAIKYESGTNSSVILNSRETYTGAYCEISYTTSRTNYAPVDNGVYFFQNKQVNGYAQIDDNASTNAAGAILELHELDGASDQKWKLTYLHNGYYKIISTTSVKAITAPSSEGNALTQENYQAKDTQMWEIRSAGNGAYYIQPKSNSNPTSYCYMVAGTGLECAIELKGSQTDGRDKWNLKRSLPTNGYELEYSPSDWSGYVQNHCNCYAYALNNQVFPGTNDLWFKQQMGEYKGENYMWTELTESNIYAAVINDYNEYNECFVSSLTFQRIGRYDVCPAGTYKVALVVSGEDYHWYRQDADGLWSHKRGLSPVERTDYSGNLIIDPYIADRGSYTEFLGYYAVTPWNEFFSANGTVYCRYRNDVVPCDTLMKRIGLLSANNEFVVADLGIDTEKTTKIINTSAIIYEEVEVLNETKN